MTTPFLTTISHKAMYDGSPLDYGSDARVLTFHHMRTELNSFRLYHCAALTQLFLLVWSFALAHHNSVLCASFCTS
jgi:hypothetical protein